MIKGLTMGVPAELIPILKSLVHELVVGNYSGIEADGRAGRLTADEIELVLADYGRKLIDLPDEAFQFANAYPIEGKQHTWAVDLDLWTLEEGRSDLTLTATLSLTNSGPFVTIDDLHVL